MEDRGGAATGGAVTDFPTGGAVIGVPTGGAVGGFATGGLVTGRASGGEVTRGPGDMNVSATSSPPMVGVGGEVSEDPAVPKTVF